MIGEVSRFPNPAQVLYERGRSTIIVQDVFVSPSPLMRTKRWQDGLAAVDVM